MTVMRLVWKMVRLLLKVVFLPVQASLTVIFLALGFFSGIVNIVCGAIGLICIVGGVAQMFGSSPSWSFALEGIIGGLLIFSIPCAIGIWGKQWICMLKVMINRI